MPFVGVEPPRGARRGARSKTRRSSCRRRAARRRAATRCSSMRGPRPVLRMLGRRSTTPPARRSTRSPAARPGLPGRAGARGAWLRSGRRLAAIPFPRAMAGQAGCDLSFSGLKTALAQRLRASGTTGRARGRRGRRLPAGDRGHPCSSAPSPLYAQVAQDDRFAQFGRKLCKAPWISSRASRLCTLASAAGALSSILSLSGIASSCRTARRPANRSCGPACFCGSGLPAGCG